MMNTHYDNTNVISLISRQLAFFDQPPIVLVLHKNKA